jgi:hypothetical protein
LPEGIIARMGNGTVEAQRREVMGTKVASARSLQLAEVVKADLAL